MESYMLYVFSILFASSLAAPPSVNKQYRSDYVYNRKTDAFYKLHIESVRASRTREVCEAEGAKPMVPATRQDIMQLHSMFKQYPDLGEYVWVGDDGQGHESAEEQPIIDLEYPVTESWATKSVCDVVNRKGDIETYPCYHSLPFVCKVEAKDAPYNSQCGVYGINYNVSSTGSCYKIPRIIYTWNQAYAECQAEGAHLVILNSEAEHQAVMNIIKTTPSVEGAKTSWFFFAGIRANHPTDGTPREFKTIFNQTLVEAGYDQWSENEPNNYMNEEYCGSVFKNDGKYNDLNCSHDYAFVCEKELHM